MKKIDDPEVVERVRRAISARIATEAMANPGQWYMLDDREVNDLAYEMGIDPEKMGLGGNIEALKHALNESGPMAKSAGFEVDWRESRVILKFRPRHVVDPSLKQ